MGLIHRANSVHSSIPEVKSVKKKTGLLNRICESSRYDLVLDSFRTYLKSIQVERAGLLCPSENGCFVLVLNTGFDLTTVRRFCPQIASFSERFSAQKGWSYFTGPDLDYFNTFFSSHEQDSLTSVHLRPIQVEQGTSWFLLIATSLLNSHRNRFSIDEAERHIAPFLEVLSQNVATISDLSLIDSLNQSVLSMKTHAQSALDSKRTATFALISFSALFPDLQKLQSDPDSQAVYYAIVHRIARQAGNANIVYICPNFDLHVVLFTALPVDTDLYFHQLMQPLEKIFGTQRISRIHTEKIAISSSVAATMDFLTGEK